MKLLKKLLIIKWHYIEHELIEFGNINFLTGKNAAGKSTIIDALQLLILGDTSGYFFNKAANESSSRNLKGYLRGELADDGENGFISLRNGTFTSYIAGEFYDTVKKSSFTLGIVFDSFDDGSYEHKFFSLDDGIPENHFIDKDVPMNYDAVRSYFSNNYNSKFNFYDTNKSYQQYFTGKMGSLNKKFFTLFRKAVPFSPIMDIEKFISEFVCDVNSKVDIRDMQDNIRYYKQLENEVHMVNKRILDLENIKENFNKYNHEDTKYTQLVYLMDRAKKQRAMDNTEGLMEKIRESEKCINELSLELENKNNDINNLDKNKDELLKRKYNSKEFKEEERLRGEKDRLEKEIATLNGVIDKLNKKIKAYVYTWSSNIEAFLNNLNDECNDEVLNNVESIKGDIDFLNNTNVENSNIIERDRLSKIKDNMNSYKNNIQGSYFKNEQLRDEIKNKINIIDGEVENLKKGIKPYSKKLMELKDEIKQGLSKKYGQDIEVSIFCELFEIKNKEWQNAVEAYLHTQKFYLIIDNKYFADALKIYDELKFKRKFYDFGLVDIEKVMQLNPKGEENSLANELVTDNPYARAYADFLLGRVIKCDSVEELRNHRVSITTSCMLYQNFTARQLNPDRWQIPYIGKNSLEKQIEIKLEEKRNLTKTYEEINKKVVLLTKLKDIESLTDNDIENIIYSIGEIDIYENKKLEFKEVINRLSKLDFTYLEKIDTELKSVEKKRSLIYKEIRTTEMNISDIKAETKNISEKSILQEKLELEAISKRINENYDLEWINRVGDIKYMEEIKIKKSPENIINATYSQITRTLSRRDKKWDTVVLLRSNYNRDYKMSFDINLKNNGAYNSELVTFKESQLSIYMDKIKDAREKSQVQFQEDFISKLKQNIDNVKQQINELNVALKDVSFGRDRYHFEVKPNPSYKKFYDMITDNMLLDGFNLFSMEFQSKHKDVIEELFKQIVDVGEGILNSDERAEFERNIEKYTDYRTYLNFDLIVVDEEGRESRLSKTITKKSGGETQTPFYISVLASFVRLYRIKQRRGDVSNTMRLIVFDEAFNKMDHQRIEESIKLLRTLELQAVVSAPTEKIADIAAAVDRNLCVTRVKERSIVRAFDPKKITKE